MIKVGWSRPTPEFRRVFTSMMIPGGTEEQMCWIDDLQKMAVDADNAMLARAARQVTDSSGRLAELDLPTLVLHSRGDQVKRFEQARYLAVHIRGAQLVPLESDNHIVLSDEPAWPVLLSEISAFLASDGVAPLAPPAGDIAAELSPREREILFLAARGLDNDCIAAELVLSVRTVERHLQNVYAKLGLHGRTARTAAVAQLLSRA